MIECLKSIEFKNNLKLFIYVLSAMVGAMGLRALLKSSTTGGACAVNMPGTLQIMTTTGSAEFT